MGVRWNVTTAYSWEKDCLPKANIPVLGICLGSVEE